MMSSFCATWRMSDFRSPTVQVLQSFQVRRPKLSILAQVCVDNEDDLVQFWCGILLKLVDVKPQYCHLMDGLGMVSFLLIFICNFCRIKLFSIVYTFPMILEAFGAGNQVCLRQNQLIFMPIFLQFNLRIGIYLCGIDQSSSVVLILIGTVPHQPSAWVIQFRFYQCCHYIKLILQVQNWKKIPQELKKLTVLCKSQTSYPLHSTLSP